MQQLHYKKLTTAFLLSLLTLQALADDAMESIVVIGRRVASDVDNSVSATRISADQVAATEATHPVELAWRSPGTWISRGSGQEHLTAIRSPVLTGAGSCGAFLFLEDGIPIRPAGFCNVNQLFEINTEQAHAVEVARGPVSAVWGANAMHGAINVVMQGKREAYASLALGPDHWYQTRIAMPVNPQLLVLANLSHDGGFRADSGFDQGKLNLLWDSGQRATLRFSATRLQQETAGFIRGTRAYRDASLRTSNPNPEAYRDADAQRLAYTVRFDNGTQLNAYARHSRMAFLQHFLPGQPTERNGQRSAGAQLLRRLDVEQWDLATGLDVELAQGELEQRQSAPTVGSAFLQATRPIGRHYDYEVDSIMLGAWISALSTLGQHGHIELATRVEGLQYRYDNLLQDGNLRDDGSACGFGGCLYNRPADRRDRFVGIAPRITVSQQLSPRLKTRLSVARGFRPPQATELYRLQRGQQVADLDVETIDSVESAWRLDSGALRLGIAGFYMRKKDVILRDADGFNISDGRTRHYGIETLLEWRFHDQWRLHLASTNARHRYDFDRTVAQGEQIRSGADVDTAPRTVNSLRLGWQPLAGTSAELEVLHMGRYFMDAANSTRYPGHELANLRFRQQINSQWQFSLRLMNLTDRRYAERADFAFGGERYFPGRERSLFIGVHWQAE